MRRSRIKAMATLPARRKATRDVAEESADSSNPLSNENAEGETAVEASLPGPENSRETAIETPKSDASTEDEVAKSQQTSSVPQAEESPVSEPRANESLERVTEMPENEVKETTDQHKTNSGQESCQSSALDETRVCPHENTSTTKVSQTRASFMRPTPRLDGGGRMRRNSVQGSGASASESEDDCRRASTGIPIRMRNDSSNSVHSPKGISQSSAAIGAAGGAETSVGGGAAAFTAAAKNSSSLSARQKRKIVVSESARKLAEARREFLLKHEHKQPDRAKLIMYDLIYYNPVTNPMKKSDDSGSTTQRGSSSIVRAETEDEDEDEEAEGEAMPVPQVKVGPDGSLMIDEQSLVIEHTGAKKSRQALARTEALVDEDANGSGFYKKRQKSKDWPKWETLKFYKALNTVGTDFLLMQSLFPKRTRQELKKKYKKEEKLNQRLVEKALTYHQEFDIDSLKEDLATFEETEKKWSESIKTEKRPASHQCGRYKRKKSKSRRMVAASIAEMNDNAEDPDDALETASCASGDFREPSSRGEQRKVGQRRSATSAPRTRAESSSSSADSASDTEIYQVKPTRSGRTPKVRKLQAPTINTLDNLFSDQEQEVEDEASPEAPPPPPSSSAAEQERERATDVVAEDSKMAEEEGIDAGEKELAAKSRVARESLAGISQVEPGSLVIVSRESAEDPGETVLQVYMVSSDVDDGNGGDSKQNMTPVVLTPELLNTVTAGITRVEPIDVKTEQL